METKVSLNLFIRSAKPLSEEECKKNPKESYNKFEFTVRGYKNKERFIVETRKSQLIVQHINICKESYDYMVSTPISFKFAKPIKYDKNGNIIKRVWDNLSIEERLKKYFEPIAHDLNAESFSFEVLED